MFQGAGEFMPTPDVALSMRKITRQASTRIVEEAFRLAMRRRKHVTVVHKANVLRVSDGLFLECARAVAARYRASHIRGEDHRRDGGAAGARRERVRRDRHHQHVRRHPLRRSLRDRRQPRARRVDQFRHRSRDGAGAARLGARHRRTGQGQSVVADRLGRDAARLARRAARRRAAAACRGRNRARARCRDRGAGLAHRRSGRAARDEGVRREGLRGADASSYALPRGSGWRERSGEAPRTTDFAGSRRFAAARRMGEIS